MEAKTEEINDSKNGVLCWFYVYKNDTTSNKPSICGIVIIKQLTDTVTDNDSDSSTFQENKIFFYTKTNLVSESDASSGTASANVEKYTNEKLIKRFIDMRPNNAARKQFSIDTTATVYEDYTIGIYSKLSDFLKELIDPKFDM
jgi:hypothetical protein